MDKLRTLALLTILIAAPSTAQAGAVEDYCRASAWKLGHGLLSAPYSIVDLFSTPVAMAASWDADGRSIIGFGFGVPFGIINANLRLDQAAVNILTFPFVSRANSREFKFEPFLTGWRPIMAEMGTYHGLDAAPVRRGRPSGD